MTTDKASASEPKVPPPPDGFASWFAFGLAGNAVPSDLLLRESSAECARLAARVQEQEKHGLTLQDGIRRREERILKLAAEIERLTKERDDARRALVTYADAFADLDTGRNTVSDEAFVAAIRQVAAARAAIEERRDD